MFTNQALAKCLQQETDEITGNNIINFLTCPDGELMLRLLSKEKTFTDREILLNLVDSSHIPHTLLFRLIKNDNGMLLFGEPPLDNNQSLQEELIQLNNQLAVLSRENVRKGRELTKTLTELNQRTDLLEQHTIELEAAKEELRFKNAELERFVYTVSHDLKSPLITITTFLAYLHDDINSDEQDRVTEDFRYIRSAADKMGNLLNELLELSQIGRVTSNPVEINLDKIIQESLSLLAGQITQRNVAVTISKNSLLLYADRNRLIAIWQNLIENAVKYMGDQAQPKIKLGFEEVGNETVFFVCDNGMGIESKNLENIFGLFSKLDTGVEGTGLGLALVKRLVETYCGRIWVESEGTEHGSCFRFTLPEALSGKGIKE
jgi:signal transduction histidine kinase